MSTKCIVNILFTVEAMQYISSDHLDQYEILSWINRHQLSKKSLRYSTADAGILEIPTINGYEDVNIGDWIVRGIDGEFVKYTNIQFNKIYKEVLI